MSRRPSRGIERRSWLPLVLVVGVLAGLGLLGAVLGG